MRDFCVGVGLWNQWAWASAWGEPELLELAEWTPAQPPSDGVTVRLTPTQPSSSGVPAQLTSAQQAQMKFRTLFVQLNPTNWTISPTLFNSTLQAEQSRLFCSTQPYKLNSPIYFVQLNHTSWTAPSTFFNSTIQAEQPHLLCSTQPYKLNNPDKQSQMSKQTNLTLFLSTITTLLTSTQKSLEKGYLSRSSLFLRFPVNLH